MTIRKVIYYIYLGVVFLPLFLLLTIITAVVTGIGCIFGDEEIFSFYPGVIWGRWTLALMLLPVKVVGKENIPKGRPCVICANHQSAIDIFMLYGHLGVPFKWVLRANLRRLPFVGWACEKAKFIFADNSTAERQKRVITEAEEALGKGFYIAIFPEGTRSPHGVVQKFKKGAFRIATDTNAPILPVSINGAYEVLPKSTHLPQWHRLRLVIHPPLETDSYPKDIRGLVQLTLDTKRAVESGLEYQYLN